MPPRRAQLSDKLSLGTRDPIDPPEVKIGIPKNAKLALLATLELATLPR